MATVKIKYPHQVLPEIRQFHNSHNARSWLLLAGYLPLLSPDNHYLQPYTGAIALLEVGHYHIPEEGSR